MDIHNPKKQTPSFANFIPFILWIILIFILLTLPAKDFDKVGFKIPNLDKVVHLGLFGGLVFLFGLAFRKIPFALSKGKIMLMVVIASSYGVIMEFVQKYCTHHTRSFSYDDMAADTLGAILGYWLIRYIILKYNIRQLGTQKMPNT